MTKVEATGNTVLRDRPDAEIEVTKEMIRAGAKVLIDYFHLAPDWLPDDIAVEVYREMILARL